ncbi:arginyltransferase [Thiohalomonas denitrificans]|uniref:Aspartate/glutamate leucyltransferase n=1 Tax=Thiohalomonas denitrificans TaxID=415747 RepID=A0A1G5QBC9_9GAMM|nr:arginyltransferase [Thiohalomonas denitrificans]SCZ59173.1 arginine-tRNA-protein transferase [Thiohalomonas denitrificans]
MNDLMHFIPPDMAFYATPPHECSYFPERRAITLFADPHVPMSNQLYGVLAPLGFRRSGEYVYRPRCSHCDACQPARIPVADARLNRSQRRTWKSNQDLRVTRRPAGYHEEHYRLYRDYIHARHTEGGMDVDSVEQYMAFLTSSWANTDFVEFRSLDRLLAIAVVDQFDAGLSAVYTFFDPREHKRGLGTFAVLWQIEEARRIGLDYVYLGYYIAESPKMAYKRNYRPLEILVNGDWKPIEA